MAKTPHTVRDYLGSLPPDRREALESLRALFLANVDKGIEEGMQYGMIGYFIPHARYPAGYHCDPSQPLPFAGLSSKKSHLSMHLMGCYMNGPLKDRFVKAWKASGKKLDMGAACVRFTSIDQVPLDVVADLLRAMTVDAYIAQYEAAMRPGAKKSAAAKGTLAATRRASGTRAKATLPAKTAARAKKSKTTPSTPSRRTRS
ncbi:MAG: DUF1801 domain-containing protein [Phycisphaerae bacterium]